LGGFGGGGADFGRFMVVELKRGYRWRRLPVAVLVVLLAGMLSGCVDYEVEIDFDSQTHGTLRQVLHLSEPWRAGQGSRADWLKQFANRARAAGAQVKLGGEGTLDTVEVWVPFNNGADLVRKFNRLLVDPDTQVFRGMPGLPAIAPALTGQFATHLSLDQTNWIVALRNHLSFDIDLQALNQLSASAPGVLRQWQLLNLGLRLVTPWGLASSEMATAEVATALAATVETLTPVTIGQETLWALPVGQLSHIDVVFWLPSPIGIGAVAIATLSLVGYLIKYKLMNNTTQQS
jgi:Protein of unknown function (DUF3153)